MTATNAACNGRSFWSSIRDRSHQPSYECMLAIAPFSCQVGVKHAHRDHCDRHHSPTVSSAAVIAWRALLPPLPLGEGQKLDKARSA
jgi:hypothetical protein